MGRRTEEEAFPDLEELDGSEGSTGAEVCLQGREGFFAGRTVFMVVLSAMLFEPWLFSYNIRKSENAYTDERTGIEEVEQDWYCEKITE